MTDSFMKSSFSVDGLVLIDVRLSHPNFSTQAQAVVSRLKKPIIVLAIFVTIVSLLIWLSKTAL